MFCMLSLTHAAVAAESPGKESPGGTPPGPTSAPSHEAELDLLTFYKDNYFITGFSMETPTEMVTRPRISPVDFFFNSFAITARRM